MLPSFSYKVPGKLLPVAAVLALCAALVPSALAFEIEMWPGEGIPTFSATREVGLRSVPDRKAPFLKGSKISPGEQIEFDRIISRTITLGVLLAVKPVKIEARSYGKVDRLTKDQYYSLGSTRTLSIDPGDRFVYLQYRAEGEAFLEIKGEVVAASLGMEREFKYLTKPKMEGWIRVTRDGKPAGWALVDGMSVEEGERGF